MFPGHCERSPWEYDRHILDWDCLSLDAVSVPTLFGFLVRHLWSATVLPFLARLLHHRHFALLFGSELHRAFGRTLDTRHWRWRPCLLRAGDHNRYYSTPATASLPWCEPDILGFGHDFWARHWRLVRTTYNLALDLLHQLSILWDWLPDRAAGHETSCRPSFGKRADSVLRGLDWWISLHLKYV